MGNFMLGSPQKEVPKGSPDRLQKKVTFDKSKTQEKPQPKKAAPTPKSTDSKNSKTTPKEPISSNKSLDQSRP
jgi:hypothetical protein